MDMELKSKKTVLWKLFLSTFYLSTFTFGGGYVIVSLMKKKFVDEYHWIDENEMLDLVAIAQSAPGAVAVNGAIAVGYKLAGLTGVVTAVFGTLLPQFVIIAAISVCYQIFCKNFIVSQMLLGMQAGVGAVIAVVVMRWLVRWQNKKRPFPGSLWQLPFWRQRCFKSMLYTL